MEFLSVGVPEDIKRELSVGNIGNALYLINKMLERDLPDLLRKRLNYEKERINRLILDYPYTIEEARKIAKERIRGFKDIGFEELFQKGELDYIIIDGKAYFEKRFAYNIGFKFEKYKKFVKNDESSLKARELLHSRLDEIIKENSPAKKYNVRAKIKISPIYENIKGDIIKAWLPLPDEKFQVKNVKILETSHEEYKVFNKNLQKTIYFEDLTKNQKDFFVEFEYEISELINNIDPEKVKEGYPAEYKKFLEEKPPHILYTYYLKKLTKDIIGDEKNPYLKAKKIYDWITLNVNYSYVKPYSIYENIPQFVATNLKGDCGFQALLFITLCRIAGVPARWQSGWYINKYFASPHDWALFYVEPYGWLPADLSFGGARRNIPEYREFYFGNLDGFRMVANNDYYEDFENKKYYRSDPYDNQVGELETEVENIYSNNYEYKIEVIEFKRGEKNE
ncbi:transglutaminase [Marinitoga sp. 1135]|uniref:Transglutaminase-like enzyme, predicted cysteine protease n=1 Tax=Marinitoga piezophila (strain DSM 14283 / JCM 11233 / KA3) TaxID=443254 RepID=H2J5J5_MARPK|nr:MULTISPECIES: transglutaminase-like domain-containing protein [Marinitoga]AEX86139.1 transglutaminase-like enzyme, predicted cysteine protease [Marinitoga piezophila KA3]APT76554.1 transglutaminase [Marinitoga sp. 1137]NUU96323.1 transglutaminase [Marinitoga sp. 1135]NUU98241.1 transglutaminase [Marinitoga sp. 1138]